MLEKLSQLIAETPCVASSPHASKLIAKHLIENGIAILMCPGSRVEIRFKPDEAVGTMELNGELFSVYVSEARAEQAGLIDCSTLAVVQISPSIIKRVFTIVEV